MPAPQYAQGWFPDPTRRHRLRWSDGTTWTDWVADGATAESETALDRTEAQRRRRTRSRGQVVTVVAIGAAALAGLFVLGVAALVDSSSRADVGALRSELDRVVAPAAVRATGADVEMPAQIGLSEAFVERTYRPARGVTVEEAAADLAAALEEQGYTLDPIEYTYRHHDYTSWDGSCRATDHCRLELDYLGDRITLRLSA